MPRKITIVGSGNWGSAIARIVGSTAVANPNEFDKTVNMWVFEELVDGKKLSEIINTQHENVKYLPGKKLPANVVAVTNVVEACKEADVLIFVVPHQFVPRICNDLKGKIKQNVIAISLIKGLAVKPGGGIHLVSEGIKEILGIDVAVLMGANLAPEVANDNFCEATIGVQKKAEYGAFLKTLFHTENFRINVVKDAHTVELCGALKNVVACAAGFSDGLGYGDNTKAAVIRLGLMETISFVKNFFPGSNLETFFESCGIADLVTTCYGGRNRKVCEAFVKTGKPIAEVEKELLNGQSAQGILTADELYQTLKEKNVLDQYPLFDAVHRICKGELGPKKLIDCLRISQGGKKKKCSFSSSQTTHNKSSLTDSSFDNLALPPEAFEILIRDINEESLEEIGRVGGLPNLGEGFFLPSPFPAAGIIFGLHSRFMICLSCQLRMRPNAPIVNVWFLVDTGSPYTYLTKKSLDAILGPGNAPPNYIFVHIQDRNMSIECHRSNDIFSEVNLFGANTLRKLRLSIEVDWENETFILFRK